MGPVMAESSAGVAVDLDQASMFNACLVKPKRLTACTSTEF
jgi:hypothetical protein